MDLRRALGEGPHPPEWRLERWGLPRWRLVLAADFAASLRELDAAPVDGWTAEHLERAARAAVDLAWSAPGPSAEVERFLGLALGHCAWLAQNDRLTDLEMGASPEAEEWVSEARTVNERFLGAVGPSLDQLRVWVADWARPRAEGRTPFPLEEMRDVSWARVRDRVRRPELQAFERARWRALGNDPEAPEEQVLDWARGRAPPPPASLEDAARERGDDLERMAAKYLREQGVLPKTAEPRRSAPQGWWVSTDGRLCPSYWTAATAP